ncbi:chemotaxis protein CheC [Methanocalculus alkaliphilus]|uniref:chemotaxis protein CheC n=1 Tax=Methanocalculus alkaliphilus TaxID=768730 RepID=UPI00209D7BD8|nr:chemotaxis protein CheC [Methanocalculus alkaliphilus]MCP1714234.1 chemotaxis protein CheC [Methanocalculus alkaliphilus]
MDLNTDELDALRELVNIGVGKAAGILSEMTGSRIELSIPVIHLIRGDQYTEIEAVLGEEQYAAVRLGFEGAFTGTAFSIFPANSADILIAAITGDEPDHSGSLAHFHSIHAETLMEVGNILINGVMGSITNILGTRLIYTLPSYSEEPVARLIQEAGSDQRENIIVAQTRMFIHNLNIEGKILLIMGGRSLDILVRKIQEAQD